MADIGITQILHSIAEYCRVLHGIAQYNTVFQQSITRYYTVLLDKTITSL